MCDTCDPRLYTHQQMSGTCIDLLSLMALQCGCMDYNYYQLSTRINFSDAGRYACIISEEEKPDVAAALEV